MKDFKKNLMPSECATNVDVVHMDKGKLVTVGNYTNPMENAKEPRIDLKCLEASYADHPYNSTRLIVSNNNDDIGMFTVNNDTQKVKIGTHARNVLLVALLPFRKGGQMDVTFKEGGSCRFMDEDENDYVIKKPSRNPEKIEDKLGSFIEIVCQGTKLENETLPTIDKLKLAKQATQKKKSILSEFLDASKYPKKNRQRLEFGDGGGTITFTPFYFTEQWAFIRTGAQLESKDAYERSKPIMSGIKAKLARAYREVNFLSGEDELTERSTLMDVKGNVLVDGKPVERNPNTYFLTKAFIDPTVITKVTFNTPRYFKAKSVDVELRSNASCEMRTNFKRGRSDERVVFCTALNGKSFDEKARIIQESYKRR